MEELLTDDRKNVKLANGRLMPVVGLGSYQAERRDQVYNASIDAFKCGYRLIDTAHLYGNEEEIGRAVEDSIKNGLIKREEIFITNKLWNTMHKPEDVQPACERSLKAMGLKYFDLYLMHWPFCNAKPDDINELFKYDADGNKIHDNTPITDTWKAMEKLVDLGLCKSIGVSNFNIDQMERIQAIARHPVVNNQIEMHPYVTEVELVEFCAKNKISVTAFSPLYNPSRVWKKDTDPPALLENKTIIDIGKKYGKSAAQVMLRFLTQRGVAVVPKSYNPSRMASNIDIFDFTLSDEDMKTLYGFNINYRSVAFVSLIKGMENHPEFPW